MPAPLLQKLMDPFQSLILARRSSLHRFDRGTAPKTSYFMHVTRLSRLPSVNRVTEPPRSCHKTGVVVGGRSFIAATLVNPFSTTSHQARVFVPPATPAAPALSAVYSHRLGSTFRGWLLASCLAMHAGAASAGGSCADVALVLAIDGSASVDAKEFDLQKRGYHSALTDPRIQQVFATAGVVDIAAVFWADSAFKPQIIPFMRVTSAREAAHFAQTLVDLDRTISGNTDIAKGLSTALDLLGASGRCADRLLIDVSSDGRASLSTRIVPSGSLSEVRARADEMGVVINALVIDTANDGLADYYRRYVAVGRLSFVMDVSTFENFHTAIAAKLMRELLSGTPASPTCVAQAALANLVQAECRV